MKLPYSRTSLLAALALAFLAMAPAESKAAASNDSEVIAKARANYPLKTCIVSDEPLGSMGEAVAYVHRAAGKPDRVIFVCCEGCTDDFKADPAKFLKKLDAAGSKASRAKATVEGKSDQQQKK